MVIIMLHVESTYSLHGRHAHSFSPVDVTDGRIPMSDGSLMSAQNVITTDLHRRSTYSRTLLHSGAHHPIDHYEIIIAASFRVQTNYILLSRLHTHTLLYCLLELSSFPPVTCHHICANDNQKLTSDMVRKEASACTCSYRVRTDL